jgi:uncharacterized radical SAM superfamily Fe-S cluster-containing enzyme
MTREEAAREDLGERLPGVWPEGPRVAPAHVELLKTTRSVCPTCLRVVDADVGLENGQVWMYKQCAAHGPTRALVETLAAFYRAAMNRPPIDKMPYHGLVIPITHRCNLDCTLCYVPKRTREDLPLEALQRLIDDFPGVTVALSGGEPTLREDLPAIIRHVRASGKTCRLVSNAIRLADRDFLRRLVDAGLQELLFSLNGLDDRVYRVLNGRPLVDVKLKALENCVREELDISISPTIFRELNEAELGPIIRLCLDHSPYVTEVRMRGAARVGRHASMTPLSTGELVALAAAAIGEDSRRLLEQFRPEECYHSVIQFNIMAAFHADSSTPALYYWDPGFDLKDIDDRGWLDAFQERVRRDFGAHLPASLVAKRFKLLNVNIWGWPDAGNLDFQEIWSHGVYHLHDNRSCMNFCEAMLRADEL